MAEDGKMGDPHDAAAGSALIWQVSKSVIEDAVEDAAARKYGHQPQKDMSVAIGPEAKALIARMMAIDWETPQLDRAKVAAAFADHLALLGLPAMPVVFAADTEDADRILQGAVTGSAWRQAVDAAQQAAWREAARAAREPVWGEAWSLGETAANSAMFAYAHSIEGETWNHVRQAIVRKPIDGMTMAIDSIAKAIECRGAIFAALDRLRSDAMPAAILHWAAIWQVFAEAIEAGLWCYQVMQDGIVVIPRPWLGEALHRRNRRWPGQWQPHSESGPVIGWPSGVGHWFWHGVPVPAHVVEAPQTLTVTEIEAEPNAEVRRVMIERFGLVRYMREAGAETVDHDERWGILRRKRRPGAAAILMLEVVNGTPEADGSLKRYWLRVHPECRPMLADGRLGRPQPLTALNAVASTYGMRGADYLALMVRT